MKALVTAISSIAALTLSAPAFALVANGDFETAEAVSGVPTTAGDWGQDLATIVAAENGISPFSGSRMLRFDSTSSTLPGSGLGSDVTQLIDLTPDAAAIAAGATLSAAAFFNRVTGDSNTDTEFNIALRAYHGALASFADASFSSSPLALSSNALFSDGNPATWETLGTSLDLPVNTTFVALTITARENVLNSTPEFDGHYADNVSASLAAVPEPETYALFLAGLVLVALARRHRS